MSFEHLEYGELRESSSHLSYSRIKSKRLKHSDFAFIARDQAVIQAHFFQFCGDIKVREIAMH